MTFDDHLRHVDLTGSWLLGWETSDEKLTLYVELRLMDTHPNYIAFDRKMYAGCYELGRIEIAKPVKVTGLPADNQPLRWNEELEEFEDVAELEEISLSGSVLNVRTDTFEAELGGAGFKLTLEHDVF